MPRKPVFRRNGKKRRTRGKEHDLIMLPRVPLQLASRPSFGWFWRDDIEPEPPRVRGRHVGPFIARIDKGKVIEKISSNELEMPKQPTKKVVEQMPVETFYKQMLSGKPVYVIRRKFKWVLLFQKPNEID